MSAEPASIKLHTPPTCDQPLSNESTTYTTPAGPSCTRTVETVIARRRSVRRRTDEKVTPEQLELLLRTGINAPSGSNFQNQRFLVVDQKEETERIGASRFVWPYRNSDPERIGESHPGGLLGEASARRETEYYTIQKKIDSAPNDVAISHWREWKRELFAKTLKQLQRWSASLDRPIHRIEIEQLLCNRAA